MRAVKCLDNILVHLFVSATDQGDAAFSSASGASEHDKVHCDDSSFLCRTAQHRIVNPILYTRKQQHRSASTTQALRKHVFNGNLLMAPVVERNQTRTVWRIYIILPWHLLFSWSSLGACIIIFLNRAQRSEKMRCLTMGKKYLLQSVKPWSDQSTAQ